MFSTGFFFKVVKSLDCVEIKIKTIYETTKNMGPFRFESVNGRQNILGRKRNDGYIKYATYIFIAWPTIMKADVFLFGPSTRRFFFVLVYIPKKESVHEKTRVFFVKKEHVP